MPGSLGFFNSHLCTAAVGKEELIGALKSWSILNVNNGNTLLQSVFSTGMYRGIKLITSWATPISRKRTLIPSLSNEVPLLYLHIMKGLLNR